MVKEDDRLTGKKLSCFIHPVLNSKFTDEPQVYDHSEIKQMSLIIL